jgi:hypothetical protein
MKYLLPCPACGQKLAVSSAQSGQSVLCSCGRSQDVPTLRDLRQLEQATDGDAPQSSWNRRKGLVFLGCTIMAICALVAGWFVTKLPRSFDPSAIRKEIDSVPEPAIMFIRMEAGRQPAGKENDVGKLIQGPLAGLYNETFKHPSHRAIAPVELTTALILVEQRKMVSYWFPLVGGIAGVGLLIALSALLVPGDSPQPTQKRPATATQ